METNRNNDNSAINFLMGIVFGVMAGYIAGILSAEKPGSEVRKKLEMNSSEFLSGLNDRIDEIRDQASDKIRDFKGFADEKLKRSAENIQDQVNSLGKQLEELTAKQAATAAHQNN